MSQGFAPGSAPLAAACSSRWHLSMSSRVASPRANPLMNKKTGLQKVFSLRQPGFLRWGKSLVFRPHFTVGLALSKLKYLINLKYLLLSFYITLEWVVNLANQVKRPRQSRVGGYSTNKSILETNAVQCTQLLLKLCFKNFSAVIPGNSRKLVDCGASWTNTACQIYWNARNRG